MLQVLRKFELPTIEKVSKNTRTLTDKLSLIEKDKFYHLLSKEISHDKIIRLKEEVKKDCSPFTLGFITFENRYKGIDSYIRYRLEDISTHVTSHSIQGDSSRPI